MNRARTLQRLHRVRTLQLGLARADEARAVDALAGETQLTHRIAGLIDAVAPAAAASPASGVAAAAHYRERLQQSADAAAGRVRAAQARSAAAAEASRAAKRDLTAIEKLIERARAAAVAKEVRALEDLPPSFGKRHDSC